MSFIPFPVTRACGTTKEKGFKTFVMCKEEA
jgi:hypothetical protein